MSEESVIDIRKTVSLDQLREALSKRSEGPREGTSASVEKGIFEEQKPLPAVKDKQGRAYATGKRKSSVARVWVRSGRGIVTINGVPEDEYFGRESLRAMIAQPLRSVNRLGQFDVVCCVKGGGLAGQAGAIRHGVGVALQLFEPELRPLLRQGGFLTRDSRVVERKKAGFRKARRRPQFTKR